MCGCHIGCSPENSPSVSGGNEACLGVWDELMGRTLRRVLAIEVESDGPERVAEHSLEEKKANARSKPHPGCQGFWGMRNILYSNPTVSSLSVRLSIVTFLRTGVCLIDRKKGHVY